MPIFYSRIPFCKEAFENHDDMACVPRQIAAVLKRDVGEVCEDMSIIERALYGDERWPDKGCTPNMVLAYARMHDLGAAVIHNEQVIETIPGNRPVLAFAVHENHCYFYNDRSICNALANRKKKASINNTSFLQVAKIRVRDKQRSFLLRRV